MPRFPAGRNTVQSQRVRISPRRNNNVWHHSLPFIFPARSPILGQSRWPLRGNLVNTEGDRHLCLCAPLDIKISLMVHTGSTRDWAPATHTNTHTLLVSFCEFAEWFSIDGIDEAFPAHLSSSGISCAGKQYGSLPPDRKSLRVPFCGWSISPITSSPLINQRQINSFTLLCNAAESQNHSWVGNFEFVQMCDEIKAN